MKKALLIGWLIGLFFQTTGLAQDTQDSDYYRSSKEKAAKKKRGNRTEWHVGIKSGLNRGGVLIDPPFDVQKFKSQPGFNGVLFVSLARRHSPIALQLEAGYIKKQSGWVVEYNDTTTEQTLDLRYLTVPVLVRFAFGKSVRADESHVYVVAGAEWNIRLSGHLRLRSVDQGVETRFDESTRVSPTELGAVLGIGASLPIGRDAYFLLEGRGGMALTNFNRGVIVLPYRLRTIYGQINAGIAIRLRH